MHRPPREAFFDLRTCESNDSDHVEELNKYIDYLESRVPSDTEVELVKCLTKVIGHLTSLQMFGKNGRISEPTKRDVQEAWRLIIEHSKHEKQKT